MGREEYIKRMNRSVLFQLRRLSQDMMAETLNFEQLTPQEQEIIQEMEDKVISIQGLLSRLGATINV